MSANKLGKANPQHSKAMEILLLNQAYSTQHCPHCMSGYWFPIWLVTAISDVCICFLIIQFNNTQTESWGFFRGFFRYLPYYREIFWGERTLGPQHYRCVRAEISFISNGTLYIWLLRWIGKSNFTWKVHGLVINSVSNHAWSSCLYENGGCAGEKAAHLWAPSAFMKSSFHLLRYGLESIQPFKQNSIVVYLLLCSKT